MKMKNLLMTSIAIFGLATISFGQTLPSYIPTDGLVGYWPFNGNANDESGNGNNGTPFDGAFLVSDRFGISNSAFSFSGPSYIEILDQPALRLQTIDFTINAWVEAGSLGVSNHIFIKDVSSGCGIPKYNFGYEYNKPWFHINDIEYECNGPRIYGSPVELSGWTNIMLVKSGFNYNFYINGVLNGTEVMSNPVPEVFASARIGGPEPNGAAGWIGNIDDVGIWNRALTQEEITSLYFGSSLGSNELSHSNLLSVFPNPAQSVINVKIDDKLVGSVFTIYDNIGKAVKTGMLNSSNTTIEVNDLSGGIYSFNVGGNSKQTFKIIKE